MLLVAGYAFKEKALEQWYLWKLESEDEATRVTAAEKLHDAGEILVTADDRRRVVTLAKILILFDGQAEQEEIVRADGIENLDVRAIEILEAAVLRILISFQRLTSR